MRYFQEKFRKLFTGLVFLILAGTSSMPAFSQQTNNGVDQNSNNDQALQKIESLKMAYLTNQLNLSPKEAQKFWPVYNQYEQQIQQINKERRENQIERNNLKNPTDQQIEQSLDRDFQLRQQALQLRENYRNQFRQVIPPRKVSKLYQSERDFNMKLIQELRNRQNNGMGAGGNFQKQQRQEMKMQRQEMRREEHFQPPMRPHPHPVRINHGRGR